MKVKGYVEPKKDKKDSSVAEAMMGTVQLFQELKDTKKDIIETTERKISEVNEVIEESKKAVREATDKIDEKVDKFEKTAIGLIEDIHKIETIKGEKGDPGKDADEEEIIETVLQKVEPKIPKIDEDKLVKKVISRIPESKADLKIIKETFQLDPMTVVEKLKSLKPDEFQLTTAHIKDLDLTIRLLQNQTGNKGGYIHGGGFNNIYSGGILVSNGLTGLNFTGSGVASVTKNATTGIITVEISGGGSSGLEVGTTTIAGGTTTRILYDNAGVLGEYTISGSGTVVAMATAPTIGTSLTASYATASTIAIFDGSKNLISASTATYPDLTELSYVKGVTSSIQTQLNGKQATITPGALTKVDDTNVTLTLGGTPNTALLQATSLTLGWTGQLSLGRGGTGANLSDPGANTLMGWDDTDNSVAFFTIGSGLSYDHASHTLSATGGGVDFGTSGQVPYMNATDDNFDYSASLSFNSATGALSATTFIGNLTGDVTGNVSGNAGTVTVADEATDTTCFIGFFTAASGSLAPKTNANLTFNSNTGVLTLGQTASASITGNAGTATALQNARTIGGVSFDGTANITVATATGGFTVSGGDLALGANNLTMTGSLGATGARLTKGWFTDAEFTNVPTVGGSVIVDDTAYGAGWNGDTTHAPSRNAVYDKIETLTGLSWGASISGTTDGGLTMTLSNSADASASALKLIAGNTQANNSALVNIAIGTSGRSMGLLIKGTGQSTAGDVGTGRNHMTLWANTANNVNKVLSIGNGTSYTETAYFLAHGAYWATSSAGDRQMFSLTETAIGDSDVNIAEIIYTPANDSQSNTFDSILKVGMTGTRSMEKGLNVEMINSSGSLVARTTATHNALEVTLSRTLSGAATITDTSARAGRFLRTNVTSNASANYTISSAVLEVEQVATQTSGTLAVSGDILKLIAPSAASFTGNLINAINGSTTVFKVSKTGVTTIGAASTATGAIVLNGTTSGAVTLSVADAAGTYTLKLPTTDGNSGEFLQTDGSGNTTWAVAGVTFKNGTASKNVADASTTQNIAHGLGTTPKYVRILGTGAIGGDATCVATTVYNGTTQSSNYITTQTGSGTGEWAGTTFFINQDGSNGQTGVVTFDSTNIIITWTKNGGTTGTANLLWEAFG